MHVELLYKRKPSQGYKKGAVFTLPDLPRIKKKLSPSTLTHPVGIEDSKTL